jgi:hypothetical protein
MNKSSQSAALWSGALVLASLTAHAGVTATVDSSTTSSQSSWGGGPSLALNNPNGASSTDGNVTDGILFQSSSSFTLGSLDFYGFVSGGGTGTYNMALYNLGSSFGTIPTGGGATVYTFTGSESDLFSTGLNVSLTTPNNPGQFNLLTFSGADQISLAAGNTYLMTFTESSGGNLVFDRGSTAGSSNPNAVNQDLTLDTSALPATPTAGFTMNNVPAGQRLPVAAFYAAPVPEPSSIALVGGGIALLGAIRRFKK